jgi:hypothetical protein
MWRAVYPPASSGGPIFFAETCFGDQIGWRNSEGVDTPVLFTPDTFETFVLAKSMSELFDRVLADPFAVVDPDRWGQVRAIHGELRPGNHYAPVVSPMVGGSDRPGNFMQLDAFAHLPSGGP